MKKYILILFIGFIFGYLLSNTVDPLFTAKATAEVAGMSRYDLEHDYDFKNAVKNIVSTSCIVDYNGSITCF